jgi:tRNA modification GTPase
MKNEISPQGTHKEQWQLDDVIVAASSPPGRSARAVIRVSGIGALKILSKIERLSAVRDRGIFSTRLFFTFGELPALVVAMPGPNSYTGEDSFELLVPGNQDLVEMIVTAIELVDKRVRRAGPGEYSLRAFLSGRLTLEQVEGVAATISARTDAELRAAEYLRKGTLGQIATRVLEALADMLALVEAGIDFTDQEDVVAISPDILCAGLSAALKEIDNILNHSVPMEQLEAAPWVVLAGNPNAGKSALMNALLKQDRAVVTNQAGTTRDALVEPWIVPVAGGNLEVLLVDSPGVETTSEMNDTVSPPPEELRGAKFGVDEISLLQQLGQEARLKAIKHATLILHCHAADAGLPPTVAANEILVLTKCDLFKPGQAGGKEILLDKSVGLNTATHSNSMNFSGGVHTVCTSAQNKVGLDELAHAVGAALTTIGISRAGEGVALAQRHRALLAACENDVKQALSAAVCDIGRRHISTPELVASAMHSAIENLGGIAGRMTPDDILGRIFSRFCVGK